MARAPAADCSAPAGRLWPRCAAAAGDQAADGRSSRRYPCRRLPPAPLCRYPGRAQRVGRQVAQIDRLRLALDPAERSWQWWRLASTLARRLDWRAILAIRFGGGSRIEGQRRSRPHRRGGCMHLRAIERRRPGVAGRVQLSLAGVDGLRRRRFLHALAEQAALFHAALGLAHDAQQLHHFALGHGLSVKEALAVFAADRAEEADIGLQSRRPRQRPPCRARATSATIERRITEPVPLTVPAVAHERAVDLDRVEGKR